MHKTSVVIDGDIHMFTPTEPKVGQAHLALIVRPVAHDSKLREGYIYRMPQEGKDVYYVGQTSHYAKESDVIACGDSIMKAHGYSGTFVVPAVMREYLELSLRD